MKNGDGILNSTLVVTKGVCGYCAPSLQAAGAMPSHATEPVNLNSLIKLCEKYRLCMNNVNSTCIVLLATVLFAKKTSSISDISITQKTVVKCAMVS